MSWDSLFARRPLGIRMGLEIVEGVYEVLGRPGADRPTVHLVGTNGKGSTAAMIDHGLRARGIRTGLYTSPHLHRVGERVRVDGVAVDDDRLREHVDRVLEAESSRVLPRMLSFFELLTLAALDLLAAADVEVLVVEAGLGGRLDATRLVNPTVVVVTSIAMDHQQWLGDTLSAIAEEKAAVMRSGVPTISAPQDPAVAAVLHAKAKAVGCALRVVDASSSSPPGLVGDHQRQNAALALAAGRVLCPALMLCDLDGVHWPGRLETLPYGGGTLLLDVAHNPAGIGAVVEAIRAGVVPRPDLVVFGCLPDKDPDSMATRLAGLRVPRWWVELTDDGAPPQGSHGGPPKFFGPSDPHLRADIQAALVLDKTVLVCGSHRLVGAIRGWVMGTSEPDHPQDPRTGPRSVARPSL